MQSYACHVNRQHVVALVVGCLLACLLLLLLLLFCFFFHTFIHRPFGGWLWFSEEDAIIVHTLYIFRHLLSGLLFIWQNSHLHCVYARYTTWYTHYYYICSYNEHIRANVYECEYVLCLFTPPIFSARPHILHFVCFLVRCELCSFLSCESSNTLERTSSIHDNISARKGSRRSQNEYINWIVE